MEILPPSPQTPNLGLWQGQGSRVSPARCVGWEAWFIRWSSGMLVPPVSPSPQALGPYFSACKTTDLSVSRGMPGPMSLLVQYTVPLRPTRVS